MRRKGLLKRIMAVALTVTLTITGNVFSGIGLGAQKVYAEKTNLFIDGDLGDDGEDDLWGEDRVWYFNDSSGVADNINYNSYAANGTVNGLGINYGNGTGTVDMYQWIESLEAGTYILSGYAKESTGTTINGYVEGMVAEESVTLGADFKKFEIPVVISETKGYNVGVSITSQQNAWVCLDSLSLLTEADYKAGVLEQLNALVVSAEELVESNYTTESWTTLQEILESVKAVYNDAANKTAKEIKDAINDLQAAVDELEPRGTIYADDMESAADGWTVTWSGTTGTGERKAGTAEDNTSNVWSFWTTDAEEVTITRTISGVEPGNYRASVYANGGSLNGGVISLSDSTTTVLGDVSFAAWTTFNKTNTFTLTTTETKDLTFTLYVDAATGGWFNLDDIEVVKVSDEEMEVEKKAEIEKLSNLIKEYERLTESEYTTESWGMFTDVLMAAKTFYGDAINKTAQEIHTEYNKLKAAKGLLDAATMIEAEIFVDKLDLSEEFIKGVDISSYIAEKESGVVYKDFEGNPLDDAGFFALLKDSGVNWVRIRVWNNPYDANGNGYGGGNNDIEKAKTMGKLATDAGLKVLIDFHYSDFWADPAAQDAPKAWEDLSVDERAAKVTEFTLESLTALHEAGVDVRMVQVGNETNNGICGTSSSSWADMSKIFSAGSAAVRSYEEDVFGEGTEDGSEVMVALHFTEPQSGNQATFAANLAENSVDYDVFATSYYPFWHGTLENLSTVLGNIASTYGKKVMVAETSYSYTFKDGDGHDNNVAAEKAETLALDYNISIQGQADALTGVMKTINEVENGIGMFYWEPAWIPVEVYDEDAENADEVLESNKQKWEQYGSGWASSYSQEYDPENAGRYYGGSSWDNQALFAADGTALDSLNVFKYVETGATTSVRADMINFSSVDARWQEEFTMPETVTGVNNDGTEIKELSVTWNEKQIAKVREINTYLIEGTVTIEDGDGTRTLDAICNVDVLPENLLVNGDFESGIKSGWTYDYGTSDSSLIKDDSENPRRGSNNLKFDAWNSTISGVTISQTVDNLEAGIYGSFMHIEGAGTEGTYEVSITAKSDVTDETKTGILYGWRNWDRPTIENIVVEEGDSVTVSLFIKTEALETWGTIDDVFLYRIGDLPKEYIITYELNGGTNAKTNPATYTNEDEFSFAAPAKEGYIFAGWYLDGEFKTPIEGIEKGTTGDITVYAKWDAPKVTKITLNATNKTVQVGENYTLKATVVPATANSTVTWTSSDKAIVTVSDSGVVIGVKPGKATITATAKDGSGVTASCVVKVGYSVSNLKASAYGKNKVQLTWSEQKDVDGYIIYAKKASESKFAYKWMVGPTVTSYIDAEASDSEYNFYRVYPYKMCDGERILGPSTAYVYAKAGLQAVTGLKATGIKNGVTVTWNKVTDAEGYLIYGKHGSAETKFTYVGMTSKLTFTDTKAMSGEYNFYRVYPYYKNADDEMVLGAATTYVYAKGVLNLSAVGSLKATGVTGGVKLTWTKVNGADGYIVYGRRGDGDTKFAYVGMTSNLTFTDIKALKSYYNFYRVYPYYMDNDGKRIMGPSKTYVYGKAK